MILKHLDCIVLASFRISYHSYDARELVSVSSTLSRVLFSKLPGVH
jgi:hypothetical protein